MDTAPLVSSEEITQYLALLFPDAPDDAWLVVSWLQGANDFRSEWFLMAHQAEAITRLLQLATFYSTYVGLGLRHPQCQPSQGSRGTGEHVFALGGLWVELDHNAGVHTAVNLPTPDELTAFLQTFAFEWSLLVDSGGGIHAYLLFKELWYLSTPEEHARAALLLRRFQREIQAQAADRGWKVDSTADLARVLRPAGSINHKGATPLPVHICQETAARYNPLDIETAPWLPVIEDTYTSPLEGLTFPATDLQRITQGCAWLAHCQTEAATLPEPEWYAMLGIVGRCEDGTAVAHAWSSPYPKYDVGETTKKLEHALADAGPRTCAKIRYDLGGEAFCQQCRHWKQIKSPIVLGMPPSATLHVNGQGKRATPPGWPVEGVTWTVQDIKITETGWYHEDIDPFQNPKTKVISANNTTILAFLRNHPAWVGHLWWDDMASKMMFDDDELTDARITDIGALFGRYHKLAIHSDHILTRCLLTACRDHIRDPLQEWLLALPGWDGVSRLEEWLLECGGLIDTAYNRFCSQLLITSMIARAFDPGCICRAVLILEGPEEYRKSTFVSALVPKEDWGDEISGNLEGKEAHLLVQGLWVAELSELDSLGRTEETRLKSFISQRVDSHIPKFKSLRIRPLRRTVFIGTTNETSYLKGQTGNTRFWPVRIGHPMDIEAFQVIRDQLFAEAIVSYYDHQKTWWMPSPEVQEQARMEREHRRIASVFESDLDEWLTTRRFQEAQLPGATGTPALNETSWPEIAAGYLRLDSREKWKDIGLQRQVGQALKALHWHSRLVKRAGRVLRLWVYEPPLPF